MNIYIRSSSCISAQNTFGNNSFLSEPIESTGTRLSPIEPDYKAYIDPKQIRRMSRVIKMGVATAKQCLIDADLEQPDAIITGTAFGCMEDTVTFATRLVEQNEELLPPTAFIQSTHNTVAAQVALLLQCHGYNNTFVHKGISFESALIDAMMLINEQDAHNVLVGGTEEMVDTGFIILTRLGLYKRRPVSNLSLYQTSSKGTIGGEGSAFVLLTDKADTANLAQLSGVETFYKPKDIADIETRISKFLNSYAVAIEDIDLIITGKNGDTTNDAVYKELENSIFKSTSIANYKHLCGEYPVSSSFALWLAANIIKKGEVPATVQQNEMKTNAPKKVLIYNHYQQKYHALMLVSAILFF